MLPRFILPLSLAMGLPLMTGACAIPLAVTAGSYAADGGLALTTNKTSTDHFLSMVSKEDCSVWRIVRHQKVCKDRPEGSKDPYNVNYDEPFRSPSEGGTTYGAPLHAKTGAPAMSWDVAAYAPEAGGAPTPPQQAAPPEAAAPKPAVEAMPAPVPAPAPAPKVAAKKPHKVAKAKKPSPNQVASAH